ncbi:(Fe-S)-binding protein [Rhodoblastus acidophilus]|uniref:(Fe-S)-binding protein n=1 Tax=Candidatus Rhodoblastus alkanivorans TaxID=2954117 RepID=A0ABS9Z3M0_9HYPH|nr:(Fe-S)-binding protein [Candidatus Rhodoblastus alkanivorans]MCI4680209.1 (Fe-S)-binding protein [Candidatus Rhodoblastus alkanivorans]MCI4682269.1 (Fe-S)-binding protein [Candidatus Rhodoblastus alkanivorans]MDI4639571.1 (Fe-S)-binding protein [Rhodoblastus acidophilus]
MKTHLDWSGYDTYGIGDAYSGIPARGGNYAKAVAVCMHNRACQAEGRGVMCPSFRITHDPAHSTEARVAAFKAALNGEFGDKPFGDERLAAAMDLCVSCKACKKECPSAVDMVLIKTEYLAQRNEAHGVSSRTRLFAGLPAWLGRWRGLARWLVTARNAFPPVAWAAEKLLGLTSRRPLPPPAAQPFSAEGPFGDGERGNVWLFVDTFAHHFDPEIAEAAISVLTAGGYRVRIARPAEDDPEPGRSLCCGRTYLSMGMVSKARAEAQRVLAALKPAVAAGEAIVGLEPSCLLSMRDEFYSLGLGEEIGKLGKNLYLFEEFIAREAQRGLKLPLETPAGVKIHVHGHCHQKAFGVMKSVRKTLGLIPGLDFELIEAGCCGMAGSFGFEAEHVEASKKMAELALLPAARAAKPQDVIVADGFSCRHQILDGAGRKAVHMAVLLRDALAAP